MVLAQAITAAWVRQVAVFPELAYVSLAWLIYYTELPPGDAQANLGDAGHRWLTAMCCQ